MNRKSETGGAIALLAVILIVGIILFIWAPRAGATQDHGHNKQGVCHPVNGKGQNGHGWNYIEPDKASSHINEATGEGKHVTRDGRTDSYAVGESCPTNDSGEEVTPTESPEPSIPPVIEETDGPTEAPTETPGEEETATPVPTETPEDQSEETDDPEETEPPVVETSDPAEPEEEEEESGETPPGQPDETEGPMGDETPSENGTPGEAPESETETSPKPEVADTPTVEEIQFGSPDPSSPPIAPELIETAHGASSTSIIAPEPEVGADSISPAVNTVLPATGANLDPATVTVVTILGAGLVTAGLLMLTRRWEK